MSARQPVVAELGGCSAHRLDLGVRGGIHRRDRTVPALADDLPVQRDDRADRHFALLLGAAGKLERPAHVVLVSH